MKTRRFVFTAVIITVFVTMFMTVCSNPFIHKEHDDENGNKSVPGKPVLAPGTPTGVITTGATSSSITISWNSVSGAAGYYVYRSSTSFGTYILAGGSISTSYTNTGLSAGTTYYYKVAAYNSAGDSPQSSYIMAATQASSTFSITISGTAITGQKLTAVTTGAGWTGNFTWGYADSAGADTFYHFLSDMSGINNSEFTIPSGYTGKYIRAFRNHPQGTWVDNTTYASCFPSNYLGPVQQ